MVAVLKKAQLHCIIVGLFLAKLRAYDPYMDRNYLYITVYSTIA